MEWGQSYRFDSVAVIFNHQLRHHLLLQNFKCSPHFLNIILSNRLPVFAAFPAVGSTFRCVPSLHDTRRPWAVQCPKSYTELLQQRTGHLGGELPYTSLCLLTGKSLKKSINLRGVFYPCYYRAHPVMGQKCMSFRWSGVWRKVPWMCCILGFHLSMKWETCSLPHSTIAECR